MASAPEADLSHRRARYDYTVCSDFSLGPAMIGDFAAVAHQHPAGEQIWPGQRRRIDSRWRSPLTAHSPPLTARRPPTGVAP